MMSSPIVDCVREIPLIVERDYPMASKDTGFPFDDDREEGNAGFRSQLDDIAARHPELAHHLGSFPFRSGNRTRSQIPEEFTQRFTEAPFPDRFERFGFPFDEPLGEEENTPYYQRYPQYYPQNHQENQEQPSFSGEEPQNTNSEVNEQNVDQEEQGRGRKLKNIQQSNTVDLGQRQEPVNERNQRSMSAPPSNNRQRFVSSINIPVNQPTEGHHTQPNMPQPSAPPHPQERVIPIHVEGRDEPIVPKRASTTNSQPQPNPQQSQPYTDKFFTQKSPNFSQYFNRDQNFPNDWFPKKQQPQPQTSFGQNQRGKSPQPQQKPEAAPQPPKVPQPSNVPQQAEAPQKPVSTRPDPIDQIKSIQKDVSALMSEVENFDGKPKDKKYLYLDEMLTRNLIKLDNVDTQGQENIRLARKAAIKCIEKCISILESKANSNVEELNRKRGEETKEMEVESSENKEDNKENKSMDSEIAPANNDESAEKNIPVLEQMEVDSEKAAEDKNSNSDQQGHEEKMETSESKKENQQENTVTSQGNIELKQDKTDTQQKNESNTEDKKESHSLNTENENRTELEDDKEKKA